jgi:hypothetical protein
MCDKVALARAQQAFVAVLNEYALKSFLAQRRQLLSIWKSFLES